MDLQRRIDELMPRAHDELAELVALRSVADPRQFPPEGCERAAQWVRERFADLGFADARLEETADGSMAVVGSRDCDDPAAPTVLLYAHYDVQPPLDDSAWRTPPFELTEVDGRWYGRGAADCKGNIVVHLAALRALGDDVPVHLRLVVEGTEEQGTGGLEGYVPDHVTELAAAKIRPEELIAGLKRHPSIAPLVEGGDLKEYSAHLIPEAGLSMMPELVGDGMLVAGDAAAMCLAAGIWLEGVNFAIGSGQAAGQAAIEALRSGDTSVAGLAGYRRRIEANFVLADHTKLKHAPELLMSHRMQRQYPEMICNIVEAMFTVQNPAPKDGALRIALREAKRAGVKARHLAKDLWTTARTFG